MRYFEDCSADLERSAVLEAGGSSLAKAVKVNVFLANMDDFAEVNEVYAKFFPDPKPVSS
jgi:enamine deaminase RidA (YjgF/YER057c/UK114 family)